MILRKMCCVHRFLVARELLSKFDMEVRVMKFNATFKIFQSYRGGQVYWWRKPEYPEKNNDLLQANSQTFSDNVVSSTLRLSGIRIDNVGGDRH